MLKEVEHCGGALLAGGERTREIGVEQVVKLLGSNCREELELRAKGRLEDGEALGKSRVGILRHFYGFVI